MEIGTLILSIIGALAWIPYIIDYIKIRNRKIQGSIIDFFFIENAKSFSYDGNKKKTGTLILLLMNLFVDNESIYIKNINGTVTLASGTTSAIDLIGGVITINDDNKIPSKEMCIPDTLDINIYRGIVAEQDNIKVIPLLLENTHISNIEEIESFCITFNKGKEEKVLNITSDSFPKFNKRSVLTTFLKDISIY